jgi:hypothetical protein
MVGRQGPVLTAIVVGVALLAALGATAAAPARSSGIPRARAAAVDPTAVPVGDGKLSTSPRVGYVDSCQTTFGGIGGAQVVGPWINATAGTWNSTAKVAVRGSVSWPAASFSVRVTGNKRVIKTNDLPLGQTTGVFPITISDPASAYDRNGNHIAAQPTTWTLPANPAAAAKPSCTSGGRIGVLTDGVFLFNALDGEGRDAVAHEVLDRCDGHPDPSSAYHHHDVPSCIRARAVGHSTLVGYARDGYGIYVERDAQGRLPTDADLDGCHGRTSTITWSGKSSVRYHYVATLEYPYTVGCYHGTPIRDPGATGVGNGGGGGGPAGPPPNGGGAPPPTG